VICHLDDGADLFMELTVNTGKGYVAADKNKPEDAPIGLIPIDAIYSPVKKCQLRRAADPRGPGARLRQADAEVETDGSVTPDDAVAYAARILQDQLSIFVNFDEPEAPAARTRTTGSSSTRSCSRRSTSWSCRCARPTA
jgi:DNA-directed RNA polymerase subunit alpha